MNLEIERKFIIENLPEDLSPGRGSSIIQGYIAIEEDKFEVRVRAMDGKYYQTIKSLNAFVRKEIEFEINESVFNDLWELTEGRRVQKTRHTIIHKPNIFEIDYYSGNLTGLVTVEVEFETIQDAKKFKPPVYFSTEITNDKRYKNVNLAIFGKPGGR